ncbi:MAG: undecaprenyl-diphosphate phosphatase [Planctomycetota bacterium]
MLSLLQDPTALADAAHTGPSGPLSVLLLAVVQGLAEFLPISSSGHLTLGRLALGLKEAGLALDVALHVGTLLAVIAAYWTDVKHLFLDLFAGRLRMWGWLILATVPAGLVGVFLGDVFEAASHSARAAAFGLFATSAALLLGERARRRFERAGAASDGDTGDYWGAPPFGLALYLGCAQACAIWPGLSRSGSTISAGFVRGFSAVQAARLSFLMSLPAVSGAAIKTLPDALEHGFGEVSPGWVVVGACVSAVVGFLALKTLLLVLRKGSFPYFAAYTAALGVLALVLAA